MLPWVLCGILSVILLLVAVKNRMLQKSIDEVCTAFREHLSVDTNTLISIPTNDPHIRKLAAEINAQLRLLRKERQRFQRGDMELKEAVTNISHDLRTPLTAISGYLSLLDKEEKSDTVSHYIEVIRNRIAALKQLTEELFQYSVVISAEYDLETEPVTVNPILEESILEFYGVLQQKKITPVIHITEKKLIRNANRIALSRIFSNILSNAIKYSDGDLEITLTDAGKITFSNTASSLSGGEVERLFDRFYTVENARKSTGLGLSISRLLIEQMNGTISAAYKNGKLSICIRLPEAS